MSVKHVAFTDEKGWLIVKYNDGSTYPPLPQYLRVDYLKSEGGRDFFKIVEGKSSGKEASVRHKQDGGSFLADGDPTLNEGIIHFVIETKQLFYRDGENWIGPITTVTDPSNPVPIGTHDIEIPDEIHDKARSYISQTPFAETWFRIGHDGDRYLHPGSITLGCVTVTDIPKWTEIYNYLIKRRKGDGKSVSIIQVFNKNSERQL